MATKPSTKDHKGGTGVIYPVGNTKELPRDFVTWHDQLPYRIWIHSRNTGEGYKQLAVTVQWMGEKTLPVSDTEKKLRLDLAAVLASEPSTSELGPTTFRNIALGQLLEEHAKLIASQRAQRVRKGGRPVNLVKDFEVEEFPGLSVEFKMHKNATKISSELGANKRDSLFIAYLYAEQCANGSKQPATLTADVLGVDKSLIYVAVRTARKYGWLSKSISGTAKGQMTEEGLKAFKKSDANSLYEEFIKGLGGNK